MATSEAAPATRIKPFLEQRPFLTDDKRYLGYISGVGAGKTFSGIIRTIRNMTEWNPGEMGAVVAPTRQMIVNVIIPEMRELGLFDPPIGWDYKSAYSDEPGIHTPGGSRALILSADNQKTIERLRGLNLAWGWIDEEAVVDPRAREILLQRLRTGEYRNLYITTTPKGKNHTYDFFVGDVDAAQSTHGQATLYETDDRRAIVGVPTDANPHTPDDYKDAMAGDLPEEIRQQEVEGQFIQVGGGVFTPGMLNWIAPTEAPDSNLKTLIGVDPAATADAQNARDTDSDYWGVTVAMLDQLDSNLLVTDSRQRRGMTLTEGVNWIQSIANQCEQQPQLIIESNQSQRWLQQQLADSGLNAIPVQTTRNKEEKLIDLSIPISNGTVQFVEWPDIDDPYQELRNQMLSWPDAAHDDLMDSLALIVNHTDLTSTSIFGGSYRDES
ncbi:hypothetical protein OSG_eHP20_00075 [environmental Halophage eHP-20]|nr:hypothetical protein OSG_eHP20_00075 [environmental Halophage eHP-20]